MSQGKGVLQLLKDLATVLDRAEKMRENLRDLRQRLGTRLDTIDATATETRERLAALEATNEADRDATRLDRLEAELSDVKQRLVTLEATRKADLAELRANVKAMDLHFEKLGLRLDAARQGAKSLSSEPPELEAP